MTRARKELMDLSQLAIDLAEAQYEVAQGDQKGTHHSQLMKAAYNNAIFAAKTTLELCEILVAENKSRAAEVRNGFPGNYPDPASTSP